jgi:hypothetical protein
MTARRPLVIASGTTQEIPVGDILTGSVQSLVNPLTVGHESVNRSQLASYSTALTLTTQVLRLTYFSARKTETTTQVRVMTGTVAAGATPTLCRIGLYAVDDSGNATLVASTSNDTTLFAATATVYTRNWSTPYAMVDGQRYALAWLVVTAATAPSVAGVSFAGTAQIRAEMAMSPRINGAIASQSDLPSTFTAAAVSAAADFVPYGVVLP